MRTDDIIVYALVVTQLDSDSSTQRREHLGEDELFVPDGFVATVPHGSLALQLSRHSVIYQNSGLMNTKGV